MKKDHFFSALDGVYELYTTYWIPEGSPRGLIQIIHGINEYMGRYDAFASFLTKQGFLVFGCDLPGHGKTASRDNDYGFFAEKNGWKQVTLALRELSLSVQADYPYVPFYFFGHSMGSFFTRTLLIDHPDLASGAILSGTNQPIPEQLSIAFGLCSLAVRQKGPRAKSKQLHKLMLGNYNKPFQPNQTTADWISRDQRLVDVYLEDPWCNYTPTVSLFRDILDGLRYIGNPGRIAGMKKDLPIFLLSGSDDPVGEQGVGVLRLMNSFLQAGCKNLSLRLYPGGRHEMLNELNKEEVYGDILAWLNARLEALRGLS